MVAAKATSVEAEEGAEHLAEDVPGGAKGGPLLLLSLQELKASLRP